MSQCTRRMNEKKKKDASPSTLLLASAHLLRAKIWSQRVPIRTGWQGIFSTTKKHVNSKGRAFPRGHRYIPAIQKKKNPKSGCQPDRASCAVNFCAFFGGLKMDVSFFHATSDFGFVAILTLTSGRKSQSFQWCQEASKVLQNCALAWFEKGGGGSWR